MQHISYAKGRLAIDRVPVEDLAAAYGTPLYVYSRQRIEEQFRHLSTALELPPEQICYGVKANSSLAVIQVLAELGAGFDVVSGGEIERIWLATKDVSRTMFSGVGKTRAELSRSLELGIRCLNIESSAELEVLAELATQMQIIAPVSLRINPDVDAKTHPYIATGFKQTKFGIDVATALELYQRIAKHDCLQAVGIDCHIGSQIASVEPMLASAQCLLDVFDRLSERGIQVEHIDLGGGFGVRYCDENEFDFEALRIRLKDLIGSRPIKILFEPGRFIVADAGILITRVLYTKKNEVQHFTVVDAAMNDLLRPSLYEAWHNALPELQARHDEQMQTNLVGPICETGDFLALRRGLRLEEGDLVALTHTGAYGFTMSSNYNTRPRAAEVMICDNEPVLVRAREQFSDLVALEKLL